MSIVLRYINGQKDIEYNRVALSLSLLFATDNVFYVQWKMEKKMYELQKPQLELIFMGVDSLAIAG